MRFAAGMIIGLCVGAGVSAAVTMVYVQCKLHDVALENETALRDVPDKDGPSVWRGNPLAPLSSNMLWRWITPNRCISGGWSKIE
jgi:hypothetical protein